MKLRAKLFMLFVVAVSLLLGQNAWAQDDWKFGIGTGFSALSLDGDIAFGDSGVLQVDMSNSDTQDRFESGFGVGGFAAKGKWQILYSIGTLTLEDNDAGIHAEWDRTQIEIAGVYNFASTGDARWGVLFGVRNIGHEWDVRLPATALEGVAEPTKVHVDEDWTDAIVGLTHNWKFADHWSWSNRLGGGFGDSEGTASLSTAVNWHIGKGNRWLLHFNAKYSSLEFETGTVGETDYYFYDVDETTFGVGFSFLF